MAIARRHPQVINLNEVEARNISMGSKFGTATKQLGLPTGARGIGCSWYEVPPGKAAFPRHFHCANEESLFVIEGEGAMRIGDETVPVGAGDYITFPVGPQAAHQLHNTGSSPLRYLCFSTLHTAEISAIQTRKKSARWPRRGLAAATGCVFLLLKVRRSVTTTEKISAE
jgi:uncharacterized cupin superfamily protein